MESSFADLLKAAAPQLEPSRESRNRARAAALASCAGGTSSQGRRTPLRRSIRRRRRAGTGIARLRTIFVVAAVLLAGVIVATPAFGLRERLADLIQGTPAPPAVQTHFASSDTLRLKLVEHAEEAGATIHSRFSPVIAAEARGVLALETPDGPIYLWAAPTKDGRQCWLIQADADATTARPYGLGGCDDDVSTSAVRPQTWWTAERPSVQVVHVRIYDDTITRVAVEIESANDVDLAVASGHALGTVPKDAHIVGVTTLNDKGEEVTRATLRP